MDNVIEISGLKKSFGDIKAVDDISFTVEKGSLFAFLGLNGAGKSTTINIICTFLTKDDGRVTVSGYDLDGEADKIRSEIGVVFQNSVLDKKLSVKDNLTIRASFYGIHGAACKKRLTELSELLDLKELMPRQYGRLSGGQRRRVDVARGLINEPKLLILDEPTTGLDPQTRKTVWDVIDKLRLRTGMTVFLTTHYMEEANEADKVVIIDEGKIAAVGSPVELKNKYSSDYISIYTERTEKTDARLKKWKYDYEGNAYKISVADSADAKAFIASNGDLLNNFEVIKGDMDDVFLNVTGKRLIGGENV